MNDRVELEWRALDGRKRTVWSAQKIGWVVLGLGLSLVPTGFALVILITAMLQGLSLLDASHWPQIWAQAQSNGALLGERALAAPWMNWFEPVVALLFALIVLIAAQLAQRRKLVLTDQGVAMVSGLPTGLDRGPWASWALRYQDITSVELVGFKPNHVYGPAPLNLAGLDLHGPMGQARQRIDVARWHRVDDGPRPKLQSSRSWWSLSLGTWQSTEDQATLQNAFDTLPVVAELRRRGVAVPALAQGKGLAGGFDLFESPRMKALIVSSIVLGPLFFVGAFLPREFWVHEPTLSFWAGLGLAAAGAALVWLRQEGAATGPPSLHPRPTTLVVAPVAQSALGYQLLVCLLFGLSVAAASYPVLPWVNRLMFPAHEVVYQVDAAARLVRVSGLGAAPHFKPNESADFWTSRQRSARYTLQMRRLPFGYWQYSVELFRPEIEAFESAPGR